MPDHSVRPFIFIGFLLLIGCGCHNTVRVPADLSNPKSAALTYLRAMAAGDVKTAKGACIGNEQEMAVMQAFSSFISGLRAYDDAINKKFHREAIQTNAQIRQAISDLSDAPIQHIEQGIVNEGPLTASVEPAANGARLRAHPPIYLRKDKTVWKVDLEPTQQADPRFDSSAVEQYRVAGKALHDAAMRIIIGKYRTLAEAQRDADANMP